MTEEDALTGLPNRSAFQTRLKAAVVRAMESETGLGLLLLDLDHFSQFNDVVGAAAADHLVRNVASRLRDAIGGSHFLARTGGDEFAVLMEGLVNDDDLCCYSERLLQRIRAHSCHGGRLLNIGASIGGAVYPRDADTAHELLKCAGAALRAVKSQRRGTAKMFHHHMRQQGQRKASERGLARAAILARSVVPVYQPKIDLRSGAVVGAEALLRWRHHRLGLQPPETLAEAFRDYELASGLGALVQEGVFRDIVQWRGARTPFGHVSINAAPAEFMGGDYAQRLIASLDRFGIPPHLIQLEITEQALLEEAAGNVPEALETLSARGIRICLDDFGTGYSSLCHLRDLPVDVLKIDRSFVATLHSQAESAAIVDALIELARKLKIDVVAEGIETEAQLRFLCERGCSIGQGYLISKPIENAELPGFLRRSHHRPWLERAAAAAG
jgi:diguanylate cyclase (GGDEF)-like protein